MVFDRAASGGSRPSCVVRRLAVAQPVCVAAGRRGAAPQLPRDAPTVAGPSGACPGSCGAAGDRVDAELPCYVLHTAGVLRLVADGRQETTSQASKCIMRDTGGTAVQAARTLSMTQESEST